MKQIICSLVMLAAFSGSALHSQNQLENLMNEVRTLSVMNATGGLSYDAIEGSPNYTEEFVSGTVYLKNGKNFSLPLRYNLYTDDVDFMQEGKVYSLIKNTVQEIQYGEELICLENSDYYFSREKGKFSLYVKKEISFQDKVPAKPYVEPVPAKFKQETDEYYLKEDGQPAKEIKNKKALQVMLGDNKEALDFIKKSKVKMKEEDLLELVRFLNAQSQIP